MLRLSSRIGFRHQRSRLDQAEPPWAKEPAALPRSQGDAVGPLEVGGQSLTVPQIAAQAEIRGSFSQPSLYFRNLLGIQSARASRTRSLPQPGQAFLLEAANPIFDRSRSITQQFGNAAAVHSLGHQEHAVQAMVLAGFGTTPDLILQPKNDCRSIRNCQCFHALMKAHSASIRNYLWPRV